jgi:diguanylate cyclase (GGDEF)-like protein
MAYRDEVTGLLGRRALNERLEGLGRRYCLAMLDVDHFKKFNDTHGHDVGDEVLKLVASRISRVGGGGTAFRYGGEEFCVVFPRKSILDCVGPLEDVRESIADYRMALRDRGKRPTASREGARKRGGMATKFGPNTVAVTVSLGLAERSEENFSADEVIKAADQALYRAKRAGRNRLKY